MIAGWMRTAGLLLALASSALADESQGLVMSKSPDGTMGLMVIYESDGAASGAKLVKLPSEEVLADLGDQFFQGVTVEWAPDSSKIAVNGRAGGRYETCIVYARTGEGLTELPSLEEAVGKPLDEAMAAARKESQVAENASQRRIWDRFTVRKWIDADTVELLVHSTRMDYPRDAEGHPADEEGYDISANLRCTLKLNADNTWDILEVRKVGESEVMGD